MKIVFCLVYQMFEGGRECPGNYCQQSMSQRNIINDDHLQSCPAVCR